MSCRYTLDVLIAGEDAPFDRRRHLVETCLIVFGSLAVALAFPTGAEKIFAVTGTRVGLCCPEPSMIAVCMRARSFVGGCHFRTLGMLGIVLYASNGSGGPQASQGNAIVF